MSPQKPLRVPLTLKPARVLHQGKFLKLMDRDGWEFVERVVSADVVAIVAVTEKQTLVLVEQVRVPVGQAVLELPAGLVADTELTQGESLVTAAKRELWEETGYEAKRWKVWMECPLNPAMSVHRLTIFRACHLTKTGVGGGNKEELEDIRVHEMPIHRASSWIRAREKRGLFIDPKIYTALFFLSQESKQTRVKPSKKKRPKAARTKQR